MMTNNEENRSNINPPKKTNWFKKYWKKYWRHQSDWLEKTKGNLMIVATVIATMSFQIMVNPPGGVWQEDNKCPLSGQPGYDPYCVDKVAGTSVAQFNEEKRIDYKVMMISSTLSFSASMSFILLVILGLRLRNRLVMAILVLFMAVAVLGMVSAFLFAMAVVNTLEWDIYLILVYYLVFWLVFPCIIALFKLISGLVWVFRKICCGRRSSTQSTSQLPIFLPTTHPDPVQDISQD